MGDVSWSTLSTHAMDDIEVLFLLLLELPRPQLLRNQHLSKYGYEIFPNGEWCDTELGGQLGGTEVRRGFQGAREIWPIILHYLHQSPWFFAVAFNQKQDRAEHRYGQSPKSS